MKNFLRFVILFGFILILGAAGSTTLSFEKLVIAELSGISVMVLGYSALCHYKRYRRRVLRMRRKAMLSCGKNMCARELVNS